MSSVQRAVPKIQGRSIIDQLPAKLAKRTIQAQRQAQRKSKARQDGAQKLAKWNAVAEQKRINRARITHADNARRWQREDHAMGPLAPKRDVGAKAATFGAAEVFMLNEPDKRKPRQYGIAVGDRVVVVKPGHRDRGKIATVREVKHEKEQVTVEGVNVGDIAVPEYMLVREQDKTPVRPFEFPMPLSYVRLVAAVPNPGTGEIRDIVIQELKLSKLTRREQKGIDPPTRSIAGVDPPIYIPYPGDSVDAKSSEAEEEEHNIDTLRIEVENRTWTPTLHMPPMPPAVLDELRNRFSRFRFRHEDEYVEAARARSDERLVREQRRRRADLMLTPLKLRNRLERQERRRLGPPTLSDGQLAAIGELMERNLNRRIQGVEKLVQEEGS